MRYNEIPHFSHPKHKLRFDYLELPFKCDGCKEVGIGSRYKCDLCDFDLHVQCALPSASFCHPFYPKCTFQFLPSPPGDKARFCNACEKDVAGFLYHCQSCGFDLHPCCARLPAALDVDDDIGNNNGKNKNIRLYLYRKVASPCHRCGRKGRSWTYRSSCKKYNLHVACVREMLVESWHEVYVGRNGSNGVKIPSLKGTSQSFLYNHRHSYRSKGRVQKCCEIAGMALQFVISAVLGDPTALIAGVIGSIISRS